jgi:hypothetical protein
MSNFSEWSPYDKFVQQNMTDGKFLNAGFTVLAAGPPRLSALGRMAVNTLSAIGDLGGVSAAMDQLVYPIGVIQNVNLSHNRTFNRIFECGSERSYFISGRTMGQLSIARILYHGPSMLRVLYAYYSDSLGGTTMPALFANAGVNAYANPHDVVIPPGYDYLFLNLASDLFNQPMGLLMFVRDSNLKTYGATYLEGCYVPNHTWATDSQGVIIQESAAIQFERALPVSVTHLSVVGGAPGNVIKETQKLP